MNEDPLARPVWSALTGPQAALATRHGDAVRLDPTVGYFAALAPAGDSTDLVRAMFANRQPIWLIEDEPVDTPPGLVRQRCASITQMRASDPVIDGDGEGIVALDDADASEMFTLARATEPGPWEAGTYRYGGYYGIREDGRLVAMAGTRLRPAPQFVEVSGVCTYPDARGKGYARRLMIRVMQDIAARRQTPFLHCYSSNEAAIALYCALGFVVTRELVVSVLAAR